MLKSLVARDRQTALHADLVSTTSIVASFFMVHIPLHTQELFSKGITFFLPCRCPRSSALRPPFLNMIKIQQNRVF